MKKKKIISIVIVLVMLMSTSVIGYAQDGDNEAATRAEVLFELELFLGRSTEIFEPDLEGATDRAAAMVMVARILNWINAEDWNDEAVSGFDDVPNWAEPHVAYAVNNEITLGIGNNLFGNDLPVTERQLQTWFDRALGRGNTWTENENLNNETPLIRADLVNKSWESLQEVPVGKDKTLIEIIIGEDEEKLTISKESNLIPQEGEDIDDEEVEEEQEIIYNNVKVSATTNKSLLSEGGGQTVELTVKVLTKEDQPASNTPVDIFANSVKNNIATDRQNQLSSERVITNESGVAKVTYTTLSADNGANIVLQATVPEGNDWVEKRTSVLVSNSAASVKGRVVNPFNGEPMEEVDLTFTDPSIGAHHSFEDITDLDGNYSLAVAPGNFHIEFKLNFGNENYYTGSYKGSHSRLNSDNTGIIRIVENIQAGQSYTLDTERGILKGIKSGMNAGDEIYVIGQGDTVIAEINSDGSFMISLPEGTYEINNNVGTILKSGISIEKGKVIDLGSF